MKKIVLSVLVLCLFCTASVAMPKAGTVGIEASSFIIGNPIGSNNAVGLGYLTYNFTDDISGGIGIIYASVNPETYVYEETDSHLGISLKGLWNLGKGDIVPHLGMQIDDVFFQQPSIDGYYSATVIALLYGFEAMFLTNFSVLFDVRVIDYKTTKMSNVLTLGDEVESSRLSLFSGVTFGVRWYMM